MKRKATVQVSALLAPAMLLPGLVLVSNAAADQAPTGPNCGSTGVLSGSGSLTCTYRTVGSDIFTVPVGVTQALVTVVGAQGGFYFIAGDAAHSGSPAGDITGRPGGNGGQASGTLNLTPGQILQIDVAGRGVNGTAASRSGGMGNGPSGGLGALGGFGGSNHAVTGGPGDAGGADGGTAFNGGNGSGGGGSSDVRLSAAGCAALACALTDRVLVGGGGGGAGGTGGRGAAIGGAGGAGGGTAGVPGDAVPPPVGGDGGAAVDGGSAGSPGTGATQAGAGTGGQNRELHLPGANPSDPRYGEDAANGAAGAGGVGGAGNLPCTGTQTPPCSGGQNPMTSGGGGGGGGGGGYFGGGGGSGGGGQFGGGGGAGGGAGGGSSFAAASVTAPALTAGINSPANPVNSGNGQVTITWTAPAGVGESLATAASGPVPPGGQITDTATFAGGSAPTGTITFNVYGPSDTTCTSALVSLPVTVSGNGSYRSAPFTTAAAGTYHWIAGYSGDSTNAAISGSCGDALESVTVATPVLATPSISTSAPATAVVGDRLSDTATLSGGANPTGILNFDVYGPGDTGCVTSLGTFPANVSGNGAFPSSGGYYPSTPGVYRWVASYRGDANNSTVRGSCGDAGESTKVLDKPLLATAAASPSVVINGPISDTATLTGGTTPTGTITFALYGPADPTCTTALTTSTATVTGAGTYHSAAYGANTLGTYRWIAAYSGDANNAPTGGACGDPGESTLVTLAPSGAGVYVTDHDLTAAKPEVSQFSVAVDGTLSAKNPAAVATGSGPGPLAVSADGRHAYAGGDTNTVLQFNIAPDGTLSPMTPATVTTGVFPTAIALSGDGKNAYVTNGNDKTVSEFTVAADGTLSPKGTVATGASPIAIALNPDGKDAYVVNRNDRTVSQYAVAADGTLSARGTVATGSSPIAVAVSPDGSSVYVVNTGDNTVSQFTVAADGTLSPKTPATVATGSFPNALAMSADGRSLYVTDKNDGAVLEYTVAPDGTLAPKTPATVTTGPNPVGIALSPDGKSAYVINSGDHTVSQYGIGADGALSAKTPATVVSGQSPIAIAVAPLPPGATTTTLGVTPASPARAGTGETLTATIAPTAPGTVQFLDGGAPLGVPVAVVGGTAALTVTLAPGAHSLTAVFTPADQTPVTGFTGSTSPPFYYTVNARRPLCVRICR